MDSDDSSGLQPLKELRKLKVKDLKKILSDAGQSTAGKKADLVLRCCVLQGRESSASSQESNSFADCLTTSTKNDHPDVTYESLEAESTVRSWTTDLRQLPPFNIIQLYDYLVLKTEKYEHECLKSSGYKKLKAYQFFKEGHIKSLSVSCSSSGPTYLKGEVLASMKQVKYKVLVSFGNHGDVLKAACQCPAG